MPSVGLGTWQAKPGEVQAAVTAALDAGYRHLDCAFVYQNENEVGKALQEAMAKGLKREDVWITGKVWNNYQAPDRVKLNVEMTLKALGVSYLDLYLVHWPYAFKQGADMFPKDEAGGIIYDTNLDYTQTWKGFEQLVREGIVRHIGVSNFNHKQIQRILDIAVIRPEINQVECHPYLNQKKLLEYCTKNRMVLTAYSPLGSPAHPAKTAEFPILLEDPLVVKLAQKYKKSPAQILIRYQIDRGVVAIPKTVSAHRIVENINVYDFSLTAEDLAEFEAIGKVFRFNKQLRDVKNPHFPFHEEF